MKPAWIAAALLVCVGCYERTLIVGAAPDEATPDAARGPEPSGDDADPDDDIINDPPPEMVGDDAPDAEVPSIGPEDAGWSVADADTGGERRMCRTCNITNPREECPQIFGPPPIENAANFDCTECLCCSRDDDCRLRGARGRCIPRSAGTGTCWYELGGGP